MRQKPENPERLADESLESLFAEARESAPVPSADLLARIAADANTLQAIVKVTKAPSKGILQKVLSTLGGWAGLGGLVTATVAGVYIGISSPDLFNAAVELETDFSADTYFLGDAVFFDEG